jgi:hypothetical protein
LPQLQKYSKVTLGLFVETFHQTLNEIKIKQSELENLALSLDGMVNEMISSLTYKDGVVVISID